jgi:anti-sigma factor RsiW
VSSLSTDCARARESVSVQLDGELSETELDRLETHLRFCPECSAWAEHVRDVTLCLREASVEVPADTFVLPRHSRTWRVSSAVALGSAAAVVATMFFGPGGQEASVPPQRVQPVSHFAGADPQHHFVVSRLSRLEDGMFAPVSALRPYPSFRPL